MPTEEKKGQSNVIIEQFLVKGSTVKNGIMVPTWTYRRTELAPDGKKYNISRFVPPEKVLQLMENGVSLRNPTK